MYWQKYIHLRDNSIRQKATSIGSREEHFYDNFRCVCDANSGNFYEELYLIIKYGFIVQSE